MPQKKVSTGCNAKHGIEQPADSSKISNNQTSQLLLQKQYRELTSRHLGDLRQSLFSELTGLHFHIHWESLHPTAPKDAHSIACSVCCGLTNGVPKPHCDVLGALHLEKSRRAGASGHRFRCGAGVSNYWFPITIRGLVIGIAFVQALDKSSQILRQHMWDDPKNNTVPLLSRAEFDHAAHLLRFIAQSAETATLAELNQLDVKQVREAMSSLQQEQDRLNEHIQRLLPKQNQLSGSHHNSSPLLVKRMLDYIHQHHAEPITLLECARVHGHNASYLSNLFSQTVGLPFKAYLTELRLEKSKELLGDPDQNINEIAQAVGYASANRFRLAFKKQTGLSPSHWRETMRPSP
ncbi:AraC family transcriptional regulator [Pontiellaceae bacterium B1224]|nr:AraC family transcriptional regulator [Pontiellaceae bacterium B1224]